MPDQPSNRLITPSQLALFSRSPVIGAWWEELLATEPERINRPPAEVLEVLLREQGVEHERQLLTQLKQSGRSLVRLSGGQSAAAYAEALDAMRGGADVIWQASLRTEELRGTADLLQRVERPSRLGSWSYIPIECKLSSHPKPIYLVQACAYCELLTPILGHRPEHFRLYLGGGRFEEGELGYRSDDFWSWYTLLRERYRSFRSSFDAEQPPEDAPGDHGPWQDLVDDRLAAQRDLVLVAGMRASQRSRLLAAGITTIDQLAALPESASIERLDADVLARLRQQAGIQVAPAQPDGRPPYRIRPVEQQEKGLAMLPAPDPGDIWFDMEGYPDPIRGSKLEYLFGACFVDEQGKRSFRAWWAHDPEQEREAFDGFMRWVDERRRSHPGLHVYHYASYEKTAIGALASRHQLHQNLWDRWRREELFVDLYPVVRNGLLIGATSYSIKKVEALYLEGVREEEVTSAADSVVQYAEWIKSAEPGVPGHGPNRSSRLQELEDYNRKDCESTEELHRFLLSLPIWSGLQHRPNRWGSGGGDPGADADLGWVRALESLARTLREQVPQPLSDPAAMGPIGLSWGHHKLLAQLIDFHEREAKVEWWEFFNRLNGMGPEERFDDTDVIAAAVLAGPPQQLTSQSRGYRYRFSASQPLKLGARPGQQLRFAIAPLQGQPNGELLARDILRRGDEHAFDLEGILDPDAPSLITLKLSNRKLSELRQLGWDQPPSHCDLIPLPKQIHRRMLPDLVRQARAWVEGEQPLTEAMHHLLERRPMPELKALNTLLSMRPDETDSLLADLLGESNGRALSLQGPPGTGKTTVTAALIARLVMAGQRVAVSSQSHEAINNLLSRTQQQLSQLGSAVTAMKLSSGTSEADDRQSLGGSAVQISRDIQLAAEADVLGATVFALVKEEFAAAPFDLLVIDEAGQVSLSNLLYMSQCARNILLVGDQQQLSQPNRAKHPDDSGLSCLDYVMDGAPVVPDDRGVFLATSWRMPPMLTGLVSELFYQGKLQAAQHNAANRIRWAGLDQGLCFIPVQHRGNSSASEEEVQRIVALVEQLLGCPFERMRGGVAGPRAEQGILRPEHILVTAPYNHQVSRLKRALGDRARVGTVDRFQGQEAPVAIHSLTASDAELAPRGIDFVLDPSRLNVAISRAQCLALVVGCPDLATGISNSVQGVRQLNRLCRLLSCLPRGDTGDADARSA